MACPTCNHTMQNLGVKERTTFWCPRCGTLKILNGDNVDDALPMWTRIIYATADQESTIIDFPHGQERRYVTVKGGIS